jgi:hypothetical protein
MFNQLNISKNIFPTNMGSFAQREFSLTPTAMQPSLSDWQSSKKSREAEAVAKELKKVEKTNRQQN